MSSCTSQNEGQHQIPQELLSNNTKRIITSLLNCLNGIGSHEVDVDYATYRLDWLIFLCTRFGDYFEREETFVEHLLQAQEISSAVNCFLTMVSKLQTLQKCYVSGKNSSSKISKIQLIS